MVLGAVAKSENRGRCINCGFVGKRAVYTDPSSTIAVAAYYEIDDRQRNTGDVWQQIQNHLSEKVRTEPFCCVHAAEIMEEIRSDPHCCGNENATANAYFEKQRNCKNGIATIRG
jgi:hypothetical protein